ncbi:solute carrier family 23 protein [Pelagicoccus sp. SDUM812002]|uniref:uracil-xanthine permease family protein n=1 Tax=Pelagicoccus sp. SDUM812002 TaxID=3041266 RepID=UPI00280D9EE0|nr:solute carrier family 23 protein [Pelagicoccus sp. SDUM812002]MDQ8187773.1 solute carrier family 23 protein [Pelagicoccus sp. SDUM812002]
MPPVKASVAAVQQVVAMFVGCITPILIFSTVVDIEDSAKHYMISMALIASGLGTFLQAKRFGFIGSGLLSINGTSFAYVDLLLRAGNEGGIALACGMALAAVPLQFLLALSLPTLRSIISLLVAGIVVLLIGLDLIPVAGYYIASDLGNGASWHINAIIATLVVLALVLSQLSKYPMLRMSAPLLAIGLGYLAAASFGVMQWPSFSTEQWIVLPKFLPYGLAFKWELLLPFALIYVVSSIEAIGDLSATARLSGMKTTGIDFWERVRGGILSDAITSTFAGLINVFPTATFSQNNGVIQLTGVGSRQVGFYVAGILVITGLLPQTGYAFSVMPSPALGGVTLVLFGMIAAAGLRMILEAGFTQKSMLIVAISLGIAFSIPTQEEYVAKLPDYLSAILSSKVATGGLVAMVLSFTSSRQPAEATEKATEVPPSETPTKSQV